MKKINSIRYALITLALVFIILGIEIGENSEVLEKATNICLQCIGIGWDKWRNLIKEQLYNL